MAVGTWAETRRAHVIELVLLLCRFWKIAFRPAENMGSAERNRRSISERYAPRLAQHPGKKGQQRNDSSFRRFMPAYEPLEQYRIGWLNPYFENWASLETASKSEAVTIMGGSKADR